MTSAEVYAWLVEATLASSAAIGLVLLVRRPLRRHAGARVAYGLWALVPTALGAMWLPTPQASLPVFAMLPMHVAATGLAGLGPVLDHRLGLVLAWLAGGLAMGARLWGQQRRFMRDAGFAARATSDESVASRAISGLPAAVGVLRPRIVLPADFQSRYTPSEQALMRCHERSHIDHGDLHANAMSALLRCVFWFSPLIHWASMAFRHDQELACDARVIALYPHARRTYGEAMLKTQLAVQPSPLVCHWGYGHPLKERIEMLKQPMPSRSRWIGGSLVVCALAATTAFTAWASQPSGHVASRDVATAQVANDASGPAVVLPQVPPPRYPKAAAEQHIGGRVVLVVDFDAKGVPTAIEVERSQPAGVFDAATVAAAWTWRFKPEMENGRAVPGRVRVPVDFAPGNMTEPGGSA